MLEKNYTKIPNQVFTAPVSLAAFKLFCYLCSVPDEFKPSITHMTKHLGIPRASLMRAQNDLIKHKMIVVPERKTFFVKRTTSEPHLWDFSCAKNEHLGDENDHQTSLSVRPPSLSVRPPSLSVRPPSLSVRPPSLSVGLDQSQCDTDLVSVWDGSSLSVGQQVRLKSKTIKQDYKARLKKERKRTPKKPGFSDEDLVAATMWQEYILTHRPKINVIIEDEAISFSKLRGEFGWDNSFLENLIKFLIKTKTADKGDFSYFWYASHLKWFLSLTSDRSQRKAESIHGQVERWLAKSEFNYRPDPDFKITENDLNEFIDFDAVDRINHRYSGMQNVTPKPKQLEE